MTRKLPTLLLGSALFLSACGSDTPLGVRDLAPARYQPVLLSSTLDPRLPEPGSEALAAIPDDPVLNRTPSGREPSPAVAANPVIYWNESIRSLGTAAGLPPPLLARDYALLQAGIYDAVVAAHDSRRGQLADNAVAAGVAYEVLTYLFPSSADRISNDAAVQAAISRGDGSSIGGWNLGRAVGRQFVRHGERDNTDLQFTGTIPTGEGYWTGTNPVLPMAGEWQTWVLESGHAIPVDPPYPYGSPEDLADVNEVLEVSLNRTPGQIEAVHRWGDVSPPVIWNGIANERIETYGLDVIEAARTSAWLNIALNDAFINCWACKYTFWVARPVQRIPGLVTVIPTPNFPTYTSGHSTISAAAAVVLGEIFPAEAPWFEAQAEEAMMSRLWGGIHFRHDNAEGFRVGLVIGQEVVERMLGVKPLRRS